MGTLPRYDRFLINFKYFSRGYPLSFYASCNTLRVYCNEKNHKFDYLVVWQVNIFISVDKLCY